MRTCYCVLIFFVLSQRLYAIKDVKESVRIAFVGDIFLGNWAVESLEKEGYDYPFHGCGDIFKKVNLVVGNLESPTTRSVEPYIEKQFLLKSPPGIAKALYRANIRAVTLANNHILDYGIDAMKETMLNLKNNHVQYFGAGMNKKEALQEAPFYFDGITYAFVGFSATFPEEFWATDTSAGTAFPYDSDVENTVNQLSSLFDVTIVSFHWGAEKMEFPKDYQVELAHLCIDSGADMVIGHHPHVIQGVELYINKPIFYSLGNFAFASYSETAKAGLLAIGNFSGEHLQSVQIIPLNVYNVEVEFQPLPFDKNDASEHLEHIRQISLPLNNGNDIFNSEGTIILQKY